MSPNPLNRDTTIADIHRIRERIAEQFDGDIAAILEDASRRQAAEGRAIWHAGGETTKASQPNGKSSNVEVGNQSPAPS